MREHQIVITLKPDQFLEVQRLARAANSKSMGVFVRQKLLAALGIEGTLGDEHANGAGRLQQVDVEAVLADLMRVHGELKAFVAESLSPYSPEAFGQSENAPEDSAQLSLFETVRPDDEEELVSRAVAEVEAIQNDELEKVAERTFAISPRLGAIGDTQENDATTPMDTRSLLARHELHYRRDVHRYHHPHAANEILDEPFGNESAQAPSTVPVVADPLSKLLSTEDMVPKPKPRMQPIDDEDDAFDVPLSIAERRRLMEQQEAQQAEMYAEGENYVQEQSYATGEAYPDESGYEESYAEAEVGIPEEYLAESPTYEESNSYDQTDEEPQPELVSEEELSSDDSDSENGSTTASQPLPPPPNPMGRPLGYPPLSGSPPPKRRQV